MKENLVYCMLMFLPIIGFFGAFYYLLIDHLKLKRTVEQLKQNIRNLEEDHNIFKGSEKENN